MKVLLFLLIFILLSITISVAQDGKLDKTFNNDGKVTVSLSDSADHAYSIAIQTNGKILAGGFVKQTDRDFAVIRFNTDGSLDNTFGNGGKVITSVGSFDDISYAIAIQPDNKIILAGRSFNGTNDDISLVRFDSSGTLDQGFGSGGKVITPVGNSNDICRAIALQTNGKIVLAGYSSNGSDDDFMVLRYNDNGTLDQSFGTGGIVTTPIGSAYDQCFAMKIQKDKKIVLAGYSYIGSGYDFAVVRYDKDGNLDNTFGTGGITTTQVNPGNAWDIGYAMEIKKDGKIIVSGYTWNGSNYDFAMVQYDTLGSPDSSFGKNGVVSTPLGSGDDICRTVSVQSDGKIILAGYSNNGTDDDYGLVRYNADGSIDKSFGTDGIVTTPIGNSDDRAFAGIALSNNKYVLAGYSFTGIDDDISLTRYITGMQVAIPEENFKSPECSVFPNPFSNQATLKYSIVHGGNVSILLFDMRGDLVQILSDGSNQPAGDFNKTIQFKPDLKPGQYILSIISETEDHRVWVTKK